MQIYLKRDIFNTVHVRNEATCFWYVGEEDQNVMPA